MSIHLKRLHVYVSAPIDVWDDWLPLSEFMQKWLGLEIAGQVPFSSSQILAFLMEAAHAVATEPNCHWEGDVRNDGAENMFIALRSGVLPANLDELVVAWKQDNNGRTFFASKRALPLEDDEDWNLVAPNL